MQPTGPFREAVNDCCCLCDGPLEGNRLNCPRCIAAAEQAVCEMKGQTIRPSDVARIRERLGGG